MEYAPGPAPGHGGTVVHDLGPLPEEHQPETDISGGLPINLDSLRDGPAGSRPFYPYATLIRYAIKGSPQQKLLLEDIYYAIESRFPYFATAPSGWKNSVRHNLSLNPCFEKVPRPLTDRGKGSYWVVNDNIDPRSGVHRVRKKKTKVKNSRAPSEDDDDQEYQDKPPPSEASGSQTTTGSDAAFVPVHQALWNPQVDYDHNSVPRPIQLPLPLPPIHEASANGLNQLAHQLHQHHQEQALSQLLPEPTTSWRDQWHNELANLKSITEEQDSGPANEGWYRIMYTRVRGALMAPIHPSETAPMSGNSPQAQDLDAGHDQYQRQGGQHNA